MLQVPFPRESLAADTIQEGIMVAAALCRTMGCVLVRFVGHGRNERTLNGKRHSDNIRREQELENLLVY